MAQTIETTASAKQSVLFFVGSVVYCILLAVVPSLEASLLHMLFVVMGIVVWIFVSRNAIKHQTVWSLLVLLSGMIWISLLAEAL